MVISWPSGLLKVDRHRIKVLTLKSVHRTCWMAFQDGLYIEIKLCDWWTMIKARMTELLNNVTNGWWTLFKDKVSYGQGKNDRIILIMKQIRWLSHCAMTQLQTVLQIFKLILKSRAYFYKELNSKIILFIMM